MKKFRFIIILSGLVALLPANLLLAKGNWDKVVIESDTLPESIIVTDPALLAGLSLPVFQDFQTGGVEAPDLDGAGYALTRYGYDEARDKFIAFDFIHYYADPEGGLGYVYYDGLVNGWSEYDGKWFRATAEGQQTIETLLGISDTPDQIDTLAMFQWECSAYLPALTCQ
jgi:hypothetical protein